MANIEDEVTKIPNDIANVVRGDIKLGNTRVPKIIPVVGVVGVVAFLAIKNRSKGSGSAVVSPNGSVLSSPQENTLPQDAQNGLIDSLGNLPDFKPDTGGSSGTTTLPEVTLPDIKLPDLGNFNLPNFPTPDLSSYSLPSLASFDYGQNYSEPPQQSYSVPYMASTNNPPAPFNAGLEKNYKSGINNVVNSIKNAYSSIFKSVSSIQQGINGQYNAPKGLTSTGLAGLAKNAPNKVETIAKSKVPPTTAYTPTQYGSYEPPKPKNVTYSNPILGLINPPKSPVYNPAYKFPIFNFINQYKPKYVPQFTIQKPASKPVGSWFQQFVSYVPSYFKPVTPQPYKATYNTSIYSKFK
jgi:hypothetical protein